MSCRFENAAMALLGVISQPILAAQGWLAASILAPALLGGALSMIWRHKLGKLKLGDFPWALVASAAAGYYIGAQLGAKIDLAGGGSFIGGLVGAQCAEFFIENGGSEFSRAILNGLSKMLSKK